MTGAEKGVLLLTCALGSRDVKPLTAPQFYALQGCVRSAGRPAADAELTASELCGVGLSPELSERVLRLLDRDALLERYLAQASRCGVEAVTRISAAYPDALDRLGTAAPPVLFVRGDPSLLRREGAALVGSRQLLPAGRRFAERAGELAAEEGYVLISGGAHGADRTAQASCLGAGGSLIVFTPESLREAQCGRGTVYCSEDGFDECFTTPRALNRNRLIHALAQKTLVAQCTCGSGGTWRGTVENLRHGWSPVFVNDDGSEAMRRLAALGAEPVRELTSVRALSRYGLLG